MPSVSARSASVQRSPHLKLVPAPGSAPTRRRRSSAASAAEFGVVEQVRAALAPSARLATALGSVLGAFVPFATYVVAHLELDVSGRPLFGQVATYLTLGGLCFSATTVFRWGQLAFRSTVKAIGFVVLIEGTLIGSGTTALSLLALGLLMTINAIATGCVLSLSERARGGK